MQRYMLLQALAAPMLEPSDGKGKYDMRNGASGTDCCNRYIVTNVLPCGRQHVAAASVMHIAAPMAAQLGPAKQLACQHIMWYDTPALPAAYSTRHACCNFGNLGNSWKR
jgi:hypothetical protein